jgi:tetratricopeptide (TPR) repeat protein
MRLMLGVAATAIALPGAASASSMVVGSGLARMCFEAADGERANSSTMGICDRALTEEALSWDDQVATYVNRGILRARTSDFAGAMTDYDRALKLDPSAAEAYLNKGALILKTQRDWRKARAMFDAALERRTRRPEFAYYGRAITHEIAGDVAGAYADYLKASKLAPTWEEPKKELTRFSVRKPG